MCHCGLMACCLVLVVPTQILLTAPGGPVVGASWQDRRVCAVHAAVAMRSSEPFREPTVSLHGYTSHKRVQSQQFLRVYMEKTQRGITRDMSVHVELASRTSRGNERVTDWGATVCTRALHSPSVHTSTPTRAATHPPPPSLRSSTLPTLRLQPSPRHPHAWSLASSIHHDPPATPA